MLLKLLSVWVYKYVSSCYYMLYGSVAERFKCDIGAFEGFQKKTRATVRHQFFMFLEKQFGSVAERLKATVLKTVMGRPIKSSNLFASSRI